MSQKVWFSFVIFLLIAPAATAAGIAPCSLAGSNSCQPTELSFWQLYDQIRMREALGQPVFEQWTQLYLKISLPLAPFFTTLLVAPLGLLTSRLGPMVSAAISIAVVFLWYQLYAVAAPLGQIGSISPFLAAWIQNLLFGGIGLCIFAWLQRDQWLFWRDLLRPRHA